MNKYSSKAIKTAATVGMSLAMVLSNVAPVVSNLTSVAAATDLITDKQTAEKAHDVVEKVLDALTEDYTSATNGDVVIKNEAIIEVGTKLDEPSTKANLKVAKDKNTLAELAGSDVKLDVALAGSKFDANTTLATIATFLANNSSLMDEDDVKENVVDFAKFIKNYGKALDALDDYLENGDVKDGIVKTVAKNGIDKESKADLDAAYKALDDYKLYLNAFAYADGAQDKIETFMAEVVDYRNEREDVYNKEYVRILERIVVAQDADNNNITVYDLVEKEAAISYKNLSKVEATLKEIKNDKNADLKKYAKYADVKGSEEVAYYIDGLETIVSEMKEVRDLLKSTNADVKAYKKDLAEKVDALASASDAYITKDSEANEGYLDQALNAFRESDRTALKNFVEDYIGLFYTPTPKQLSSGKYVVRLENADYGRYVESTEVFKQLLNKTGNKGLDVLLTAVIDSKNSADTYYDTLISSVTTVEELLKAVTTDIEGITLNTTMTTAQAAKIVAAKKALNQLYNTDNGTFYDDYSLTAKEKKTVKGNATLIDTLYLKLILNGTVTESGWVDKGNGDWDYIAEDGSRPTKWVASGANWYYVKNGTMLRNSWIASDAQGTRWYYVDDNGVMVSNTTVNGYTFNSYGVWVK